MTSRDWRVDSLRGYFLVLMTLAHLPQHPLQRFSSYTFGYASAPDGFVFLLRAGVHVGLPASTQQNTDNMHWRRESFANARRVPVHIVLLSASIGGAVLLITPSFQAANPVQTFVSGSLLLYQPDA